MEFQRNVIDVVENNDGEKKKRMSLMWMKAMMKEEILRI